MRFSDLFPERASVLRVVFGTLLVLAGLAAALVTVLARRQNDAALAGAAAIFSLLIALLLTIFIVPPLARSAKVEVTNLDFPFEPTSGGGVFLVIIVVVGFAAWNTGNNLLFLVFSLLVSTLFVGWIAARASLRDLTVSARFPDHIFAAEPAPVIVTLRNTKRVLPSFSILVEARGPTGDVNNRRRKRYAKRVLAYFSYVPHHAAAEQRVEQLFPQRGHVLIDGFELSTRFPFGFFRRRRRLRARNVDIIVYPKPAVISDELHLLPMYAGRIPSLRRGAGHDLFSLRDYQPQDDLRHIDWKATARSRRLTVREFTSEDERRITIVLDTRLPAAPDDEMKERFERGVVHAASLLKHFVDERAEVRLVLGDEAGPFGSGTEQLYRCLRRLALVTPLADGESHSEELEIAGRDVVQHDYAILLTAAAPGSIPANVWRTSHVIYL
ncbi:MAG TPA: DUF58 domain-containing protein [Pyrinomonadaceae bacterium]|nr:DUF58 domain-containing protein [Pyrinomonadaceae bacterium]